MLMSEVAPWMLDAACRDTPTDLFFPAGNPWTPHYRAQIAEAARICRDCPVIWQCRSAANQRGEHHGVWGGADFGAYWSPSGTPRRRRPRVATINLDPFSQVRRAR